MAKFIEEENIDNGIIYSLEKNHIPYVLGGSIRDDGPLPPVYADVYQAQDAMRNQVRDATTVICMATMLHTIATGNMTPSFRVMPTAPCGRFISTVWTSPNLWLTSWPIGAACLPRVL